MALLVEKFTDFHIDPTVEDDEFDNPYDAETEEDEDLLGELVQQLDKLKLTQKATKKVTFKSIVSGKKYPRVRYNSPYDRAIQWIEKIGNTCEKLEDGALEDPFGEEWKFLYKKLHNQIKKLDRTRSEMKASCPHKLKNLDTFYDYHVFMAMKLALSSTNETPREQLLHVLFIYLEYLRVEG